jgi:hypothetical protein
MILVVETQRANYLFSCPSAAEAFAAGERRHWSEMCSGIGPVPIKPVPLSRFHRFSPADPDCPMEFGAVAEMRCNRIRRHVRRWWAERDAWWAAA